MFPKMEAECPTIPMTIVRILALIAFSSTLNEILQLNQTHLFLNMFKCYDDADLELCSTFLWNYKFQNTLLLSFIQITLVSFLYQKKALWSLKWNMKLSSTCSNISENRFVGTCFEIMMLPFTYAILCNIQISEVK